MMSMEDRTKAGLLLKNAGTKRYSGFREELARGSFLSRDKYPVSVPSMFELMCKYSRMQRGKNKNSASTGGNSGTGDGVRTGTILAQIGENNKDEANTIAGTDGRTVNTRCYNCGRFGHVSYNCLEEDKR